MRKNLTPAAEKVADADAAEESEVFKIEKADIASAFYNRKILFCIFVAVAIKRIGIARCFARFYKSSVA